MKRWYVMAVLGLLLSACGCRTMHRPASETSVDQQLNTSPAPSEPLPNATANEPRPSFEQEPPKSQNP